MKKQAKGHHGHTYCGGLCVPHFLHEQFEEQLGPKAQEFDLLAWYPKRDAQRKREMIVIEEPLTWWREALRAEMAFRGWIQPQKRKELPPQVPIRETERWQRMQATFGRTEEEKRKGLQQLIDYRARQAKS